jgi:hypothetical protein
MNEQTTAGQDNWTEEFQVETDKLLETLKRIISEGNARRVIIRKQDDSVLLDLPLPFGLLAGGILAWYAPVIAVVTAIGGAAARLKVQVIHRVESGEQEPDAEL